ncbi:MAG TPA: replication-relaxation family protein [Candidatus Bathyarchaeia archaeon]|nr:replication-relaxation family protein [Candidatus Bathyarchaeia archaeon]
MLVQQKRFERKVSPPPMRFQDRDGQILQAIQTYDGVLARRQIKQLFWPQASLQAMERRLTLLYHTGYLNMPDFEQRRIHPIPEPVVWLSWRGIVFVASQIGVEIDPPTPVNENKLRKLEKQLREAGVRWQREPRWSQLAHDVAVNDFRLTVEQAAEHWPSLSLEEWIPEGEFLTNMDTVTISEKDKQRKGVRPDGFFILVDHLRQIDNSPAKARFLLELDNSTHPLNRFGRDKALAGLAYIRSSAYRKRFSFNSGRWLVVCKSKQRMLNLKMQTEKVIGKQAGNFLFTTFDKVQPSTVLNIPIWLKGGSDELIPLVSNIGVSR